MATKELRICEAVMRLVETELARRRDAPATYPEKDRSGPPIDCRFQIDGRQHAIEHTLIEPFPHHIKLGVKFDEFVHELVTQLDGKLPTPGRYVLSFPIDAGANHKAPALAKLRADLALWVTTVAAEMHAEAPTRQDRDHAPAGFEGRRTATFQGLTVTLNRRVHWSESGRHDGRLYVDRIAPANVEDMRLVRVKTALEKKLAQLAPYKAKGDTTVLVLETDDVALTNQVLVAEALAQLLPGRADLPDRIVLASTEIEDEWTLYRMAKGDTVTWDDMSPIDCDPADLGTEHP